MKPRDNTIVAVCTPPGRSAIGVIRLSGSDAFSILQALTLKPSLNLQPNLLKLQTLFDPDSEKVIDQALVCYFKAPHSFTGEDVVELHCHGSPILLQSIIDITLKLGAWLADPGEFSLRAVKHGRIKLTEAEAIRDLIDAQTDAAVRQATRQMKGDLSNTLRPLKEALLDVIVRLESAVEFVEDDLPNVEGEKLIQALRSIRSQLSQLSATFAPGRLLRDGLKIALVGRPNVGKSSLFNRLLGRNRAIVTAIPGTTRDTLTEAVGANGIPVLLIDTAGIRESDNQIELLGVERTRREAADADLVIVVIDGADLLLNEDQLILAELRDRRYLIALNKCDLASFSATLLNRLELNSANCTAVVSVSAKTGAGIESLQTAMLKPFVNGNSATENLLITNVRHHDLLLRSIAAIVDSEIELANHASEEVVLIGLHNALGLLAEITGETTTDEILGRIFSTFCIGK